MCIALLIHFEPAQGAGQVNSHPEIGPLYAAPGRALDSLADCRHRLNKKHKPPVFQPASERRFTRTTNYGRTSRTLHLGNLLPRRPLSAFPCTAVHRYVIVYLFFKHRKNVPVPVRRFENLPRVTVQLPIFNELYVVERLLESVSKLDYPRNLLQIQVLDDSTDETREISASPRSSGCGAEGFDIEHVHRVDRTGFKAGALREPASRPARASSSSSSMLISFPGSNLLMETIHFFTDPGVGMIQSPLGASSIAPIPCSLACRPCSWMGISSLSRPPAAAPDVSLISTAPPASGAVHLHREQRRLAA